MLSCTRQNNHINIPTTTKEYKKYLQTKQKYTHNHSFLSPALNTALQNITLVSVLLSTVHVCVCVCAAPT